MPPPVALPKAPGWVAEFRAFIMRGNVVDLAVGILINAVINLLIVSFAIF